MYNKRKFNKINDKKVLHKVKKQWVTMSLALLMMVGSGVVVAHVSANADTVNNQQPVSTRLSRKNNQRSVTNKAKTMHTHLLANSAVKKNAGNARRDGKNVNEQNIDINYKPAKRLNNINQLHVHQAGINRGRVYSRVSVPFNRIKILRHVLLHSNVQSIGSRHHVSGKLNRGKIVKISKAFRRYDYHNHSYLSYEVPLVNRHFAFITSNAGFVSYVAPTSNYRYYKNRAGRILKHAHSKKFNRIKAAMNKLTTRRNRNYKSYMNLYTKAYDTRQALRYPVIITYGKNYGSVNKGVKSVSDDYPVASQSSNQNVTPSAVTSFVSPSIQPVVPIAGDAVPSSASASSSTSSVAPSSVSSSVAPSSASSYVAPSSSASSASVKSAVPSQSSSNRSVSSSAKPSQSKSASVAPASSASSSNVRPSSSSSASSHRVSPSSKASAKSKPASTSSKPASQSSRAASAKSSSASAKSSVAVSSVNSYQGSYIYKNNSLEFTHGTLTWNAQHPFLGIQGSNYYKPTMSSRANIDLNKIKSVKFDSDVKFSSNPKEISDLRSTQQMFYKLPNLQSITFSKSFNTRNVTDMNNMFNGDVALQTLTLPTSFDTHNVTNMSGMFTNDSSLNSLTLPTSFDTGNVTDMSGMFMSDTHLSSLTLPTSFDTEKVTDMSNMFDHDENLRSLSLPASFNTGNVKNMSDMFRWDSSLRSLTLPASFNTANVTNMMRMFSNDTDLALTLPASFDTTRANMIYMFAGTTLKSLRISSDRTKFSSLSNLSPMYNGSSSSPVTLADNQVHVGTWFNR